MGNLIQDAFLQDNSIIQSYKIIPVSKITSPKHRLKAHRLNALGSLYYFIKVVLRRRRLNPFDRPDHIHVDMCRLVERTILKEVIEIPRDHFKSTIYSEGTPMWWALPFMDEDEDLLRVLGYDDFFIAYMKKVHNQNTRTLLVSETESNAIKLGFRISHHYENNDFFRTLFPEILPDSSCIWNTKNMMHKRTKDSPDGEGTYDFLGVGGALQSRHYNRVIQDDLVGKEAIESEIVMRKTIDYYRLLVGAFDGGDIDYVSGRKDNDEIVVGNRWAYSDLNSHIRQHEPYYRITTHSAIGGCCDKHPFGKCIFPEEFNEQVLDRWQRRLGTYLYSCQFLNNPTAPKDRKFKESDLRYYDLDWVSKTDTRIKLVHQVINGQAIKDVFPNQLTRTMTVDPNHAEEEGRCKHAIVITGVLPPTDNTRLRIYLLDVWAEASSSEELLKKIWELAEKWKLKEFWIETEFGQKFLKKHFEYRNMISNRVLKVNDLKSSRSKDAKERRIEALQPFFENGQFWMRASGQENFFLEYKNYPNFNTRDILDALSYAPETWNLGMSTEQMRDFLTVHKDRTLANIGYGWTT